jgi:hypothetical protein
MKFAGGSGCGEVLWLLSYAEEVEGRTTSFLGRNVVTPEADGFGSLSCFSFFCTGLK